MDSATNSTVFLLFNEYLFFCLLLVYIIYVNKTSLCFKFMHYYLTFSDNFPSNKSNSKCTRFALKMQLYLSYWHLYGEDKSKNKDSA